MLSRCFHEEIFAKRIWTCSSRNRKNGHGAVLSLTKFSLAAQKSADGHLVWSFGRRDELLCGVVVVGS